MHLTPTFQAHAPRLRTPDVRGISAYLRREDGVALVELALVLPLLLLLIFGIAQFGLALNSANDETHLANLVARYATVNEDPGGGESLQKWAKKGADASFLKNGGTICISFPSGTEPGDPVKVEVKSLIKWFPVIKLKVASSSINGTAYMRLETPPTTYSAGCA